MIRTHNLNYQPDSSHLFNQIAAMPWSILLDSGIQGESGGRFDILVAEPFATLITRGALTQLDIQGQKSQSRRDPFTLIRDLLGTKQPIDDPSLPFIGGALGYFSYDLGRWLEQLPAIATDDEQLPEMAIGLYDWAIIVDHQQQKTTLATAGRITDASQWATLIKRFSNPEKITFAPFETDQSSHFSLGFEAYQQAFDKIQHYIRAGDCYQVNFAQRFSVTCKGSPWRAYQQLRKASPAPFSAYLNLPFAQILSASPERFIRLEERQVTTQPIKGTRPRAKDPLQDQALAQTLLQSPKEQAENLMIVDLLRNDLSKNCTAHSVKTPKLFELHSFSNVHHLVSTITGELEKTRDALHLLRDAFPGGSVTGAPKIRAMEIIEHLEPHRRGIYCGTIGYIGFNGNMDTNIAIRSLSHHQQTLYFWAGGGIVADSTAEEEYRETLDKAAALLELFGNHALAQPETASAEILRAKLNLETGRIAWPELQRHFARGIMLTVSHSLDLVDVAYEISQDNQKIIAQWLASGKISKASTKEAKRWQKQNTEFWALVVAPWVIVQEEIPDNKKRK